MKKRLIAITAALAALLMAAPAYAGIRCGNDIISEKDTKMAVLVKLKSCGEVLDKDTYTKESGKDGSSTEKLVEQWYVRVKEKGSHYCYQLVFEEGLLETIGNWTRCD